MTPPRSEAIIRDDIEDILRYYEGSGEEGRLDRQQLEFFVTLLILKRYLKSIPKGTQPHPRVLELGCGAGRYTTVLAHEGCQVTAIDLSPKLIESARAAIAKAGFSDRVELHALDARGTTELLAGKKFDLICVMGPLYHLVKLSERAELVREMSKLLEPGGILLTNHMTKIGLVSHQFARYPEWVAYARDEAEEFWRTGQIAQHPRSGIFRGYWSTLAEAKELHTKAGLKLLGVHSQDPAIGAMDEIFNRLPIELKLAWADYLFNVGTDPDTVGSGRHFFCVSARKG